MSNLISQISSKYNIMYENKDMNIYTNNHMRFFLGKEENNRIVKKLDVLIDNYQFILSELKSRIEYVDLRYKDGFAVKKLNEKLHKINKQKKTAL